MENNSQDDYDASLKRDKLNVLYKSENYIIIDKHYDMKINANQPHDRITVETLLCRDYPHLRDEKVSHSFRFTHRLDYATSGALCLALNKKAARKMQAAFVKHEVTKHYIALVRGYIPFSEHYLDISIGKDSYITDFNKMCVSGTKGCLNPRSCLTHMIRLEHGTFDSKPASKVLLIPKTGRTHQLRVHCAHIGHCIVGDFTYSDRQDTKPVRMMLHACMLKAPTALECIDVQSDDPFTPENYPLWKPTVYFKKYEDGISSSLDLESQRKENLENIKTETNNMTGSETVLCYGCENLEIGTCQTNLKSLEMHKSAG